MSVELEIVNAMIVAVRGTPVTSTDNRHPVCVAAVSALAGLSRKMQARGWWFNRNKGMVLSPNLAGNIILPDETLSIKIRDSNQRHLVKRGNRLYDPLNNTYTISGTVTLDIIIQLSIEDLPPSAQEYLSDLAVCRFFTDRDGDVNLVKVYQGNMATSYAAMRADQLRADQTNNNQNPRVMSIMAVQQPRYLGGTNPNYPGGRKP